MVDKAKTTPEAAAAGKGTPEADQKMLMRRRILKAGAIGAPIVVTMQSNAAWAASVLCTEGLKVPQNIPDSGDPAQATGPLIPFNQFDPRHDKYFQLVAQKQYEGLPGHSCAVSLIGIK